MGLISHATPLSWLQASTSAFRYPPLPLQSPNSPLPSPYVYPVFSGSHSSHTHPLSGRDSEQKHSTNFCPRSSMPPLTSLSDQFSGFLSCFCPPLIPITLTGHMFLQGFHHSGDISINSHWKQTHSCIIRTDLSTLSPFVYVSVRSHAPLKLT